MLAQKFSSQLDSLFGLDDLSATVEEKKEDVSTRQAELAELQARLQLMEDRMHRRKPSTHLPLNGSPNTRIQLRGLTSTLTDSRPGSKHGLASPGMKTLPFHGQPTAKHGQPTAKTGSSDQEQEDDEEDENEDTEDQDDDQDDDGEDDDKDEDEDDSDDSGDGEDTESSRVEDRARQQKPNVQQMQPQPKIVTQKPTQQTRAQQRPVQKKAVPAKGGRL